MSLYAFGSDIKKEGFLTYPESLHPSACHSLDDSWGETPNAGAVATVLLYSMSLSDSGVLIWSVFPSVVG